MLNCPQSKVPALSAESGRWGASWNKSPSSPVRIRKYRRFIFAPDAVFYCQVIAVALEAPDELLPQILQNGDHSADCPPNSWSRVGQRAGQRAIPCGLPPSRYISSHDPRSCTDRCGPSLKLAVDIFTLAVHLLTTSREEVAALRRLEAGLSAPAAAANVGKMSSKLTG